MKLHSRMRFAALLLTLAIVAMMALPAVTMAAAPPVPLGRTAGFAVLAGSTVTNTGSTRVSGSAGGDIGVAGGSAITGFPPGILTGTRHSNDALAIGAQTDWVTAYNNAADNVARPITTVTGVDLGGLTLGPGVYSSGDVLSITGTLTLDAGGDPEAVFIFRSTSTLITASSSVVRLVNGARFCRVFWVVPSSATLATGSTFVGHIFAVDNISVKTGATVQGQLLAHKEAVTLESNRVTNGICVAGPAIYIEKFAGPTALTSGPGPVTYTYEVSNPGTVALSLVAVTDDKIKVVTYVSGDANANGLLDLNETWIYTATTTLNATTTNIATARGSAGEVAVSATASATVAVAGRLLPNTATPWYDVLLGGFVLTLLGAAGYWITARKIHA